MLLDRGERRRINDKATKHGATKARRCARKLPRCALMNQVKWGVAVGTSDGAGGDSDCRAGGGRPFFVSPSFKKLLLHG